MLELKNITAGYGRKDVLKNLNLKINSHSMNVIMGPNGAGKSTLLNVIYGLLKHKSGEIYLDGKQITPTAHGLVKENIFMVPQGYRVFPHMTILENIEIATHVWKDRTKFKDKLDEVLEHFEALAPRLNNLAGTLSGGQQQMVAIARVLINDPKLVLLDEPSIGLSPLLIQETFERLRNINKKKKTGFIIVEHNLKSLLPLTDNAFVLQDGQITYSGKSEGKVLDEMLDTIFK